MHFTHAKSLQKYVVLQLDMPMSMVVNLLIQPSMNVMGNLAPDVRSTIHFLGQKLPRQNEREMPKSKSIAYFRSQAASFSTFLFFGNYLLV